MNQSTDLKSQALALIAAGEKCTDGPWVSSGWNGNARVRIGNTGPDAHWLGECNGRTPTPDAEFIALSRNVGPRIAKALIAALRCIDAFRDFNDTHELLGWGGHEGTTASLAAFDAAVGAKE